jgi:plastocyanin
MTTEAALALNPGDRIEWVDERGMVREVAFGEVEIEWDHAHPESGAPLVTREAVWAMQDFEPVFA